MANIRIDLDTPVRNGQAVTFKSPAASADISGLVVYYPDGSSVTSKTFKLVDAHGQDVGSGTISLFAANALVKVVLDTDAAKAYVQNADTNAYLEGKLAEKYSPSNKPTLEDLGASAKGHKHTKSEITDFPTSMPASDVPSWAKAQNKPSYTPAEIGLRTENWTFTLEDGSVVTKAVYVG